MKKLIIVILSLASLSSYAKNELTDQVCGNLGYILGNYVLIADDGDNYTVREGKISRNSVGLTSQMKIIIQNHDYNESNYPKVCFYSVESERIDSDQLDVIELGDIQKREFLN